MGGYNVFPRNIGRRFTCTPPVEEVLVIGVPQADLGSVAKAYVSLKPGQPTLSYKELCEFLVGKLASYEMPMALEVRASLPKTPVEAFEEGACG